MHFKYCSHTLLPKTYIVRNNIKLHWTGNNGHHMLRDYRSRCQHSILNRFILKTLFRICHVSPCIVMNADLFLSWFVSAFVHEIYKRGDPFTYVYCVGFFCIHVTPCTRKNCKLSFDYSTLLMTKWNASGQWPFLSSKCFFH